MAKTITILSWNVNGVRAVEKKGFVKWLESEPADIVCVQETKAQMNQLSDKLLHPNGYESYWNSAERKGYSGVGLYTKPSPIMVVSNFGNPVLDGEGRILMAEYDDFILFNVYFPNGGQGPERLKFKLKFYDEFLKLAEQWRKKKPIIICGDVNTAHTEDDLARPKENEKTSGFLPVERKWLDELTAAEYIDTFRLFTKGNGHYSWWDMKSHARSRNVGWRLDYFWVSDDLVPHVKKATIESEIDGSDHCPVGLTVTI
ncbi:MAG: exodeoxyribonuclease III [Patescibacteria group bacterium]